MSTSQTTYHALQPTPVGIVEPITTITQRGPIRACYECRRKKTKCDMIRPLCGLCMRNGIACVFPSSRKRPSLPTTTRPGKTQKVEHQLSRLIRLLEGSSDAGEPDQELTEQDPGQRQQQQRELQSSTESPASEGAAGAIVDNDLFYFGSAAPPRTLSDIVGAPNPMTSQFFDNSIFGLDLSPTSQAFLIGDDIPNPPTSQIVLNSASSNAASVSFDLAMHLVHLFFDKIQPWLPLLHKPRFLQQCEQELQPGPNALANLEQTDCLVFLSLFSLAARFSDCDCFADQPARLRGDKFREQARAIYSSVRDLQDPSIQCLQGTILLAFSLYTSEVSSFGWVLVGVCTRWLYDLGLSKLDDAGSPNHVERDWVQQEELRRAWWLVWELDTFGSFMLLRPFAIDRRRIHVKLPVSDEAWFGNAEVESQIPLLRKRFEWKLLRDSPNQDARSWFLIANIILSQVFDRLLGGESLEPSQRVALINDIQCFRLALPKALRLQAGYLSMNNSIATNNWVIGAHLLLAAASFMLDIFPGGREDSQHDQIQEHSDLSGRNSMFLMERSRILGVWPSECLEVAHPFFICTMIPLFAPNTDGDSHDPMQQSCNELVELIQERFAEHWGLGEIALRTPKIALGGDAYNGPDVRLSTRLAIYMRSWEEFHRSLSSRSHGYEGSPNKHKGRTTSSACPSEKVTSVQAGATTHYDPGPNESAVRFDLNVLETPTLQLDRPFKQAIYENNCFVDTAFQLNLDAA